MARRITDRHILIDSFMQVTDLPILTGRFVHAHALLEEAQALIDADPDQGARAMVVGKRAWLALERGDIERARAVALLEAGAVPALEAGRLRAALGERPAAATINAGSTPRT